MLLTDIQPIVSMSLFSLQTSSLLSACPRAPLADILAGLLGLQYLNLLMLLSPAPQLNKISPQSLGGRREWIWLPQSWQPSEQQTNSKSVYVKTSMINYMPKYCCGKVFCNIVKCHVYGVHKYEPNYCMSAGCSAALCQNVLKCAEGTK